MTRAALLALLRAEPYAVQASLSPDGPQAAVVGIVIGDAFEIVFDTLATSRKAHNLLKDSRVAFVIGGTTPGAARTVQYEGVADAPAGAALAALKQLYFARFPDGRMREALPGILYLRVRPHWVRVSDFTRDPPDIVEFSSATLAALD